MPDSYPNTAREAIDLVLIAGKAEIASRRLSGEQRQSAFKIRRAMLTQAADRFAQNIGGTSAFEDTETTNSAPAQDLLELETLIAGDRIAAQDLAEAGSIDREATEWLTGALGISRRAAATEDDRSRQIATVLFRSVIRPLCIVVIETHSLRTEDLAASIAEAMVNDPGSMESFEEELVDLTLRIGESRRELPEIDEAYSALIGLCQNSPSHGSARLEAQWKRLQAIEPRIRVAYGGPYLVTGQVDLTDYLGVSIDTHGSFALCRCGQSKSKPFCDGSHAVSGFTVDKDPRRVPDRRDTYEGQQIVILDNRGLCAHSGFCTDRLSAVFHLGKEPFVTPSGARLDDILRAVRRCPSGALSAAIDDREMRECVDRSRRPTIEISKGGPYRVTGGIPVLDDCGELVQRNLGASHEHYSLCRCGSSLNKPFCSGMHWSVGFADPLPPDREPTLFEWAGGYPALLDTTSIFYGRHVPSDPVVGPLFAQMEADHPERVAAWLSEVFGGPAFYSERYGGYARMISQHLDKHLTQEQRSHWARLMLQSADEAGLPSDPEFRAAFVAYIEWGSRIAVENSTAGAKPPEGMPVPKWWWVCSATPGARISSLHAKNAEDSSAPAPLESGEVPGFAKHIKPLFRTMDRASMRFVFDLWSHDDVSMHADAILKRLEAGTMPCDGAWPPERVNTFRRWVQEGKQG